MSSSVAGSWIELDPTVAPDQLPRDHGGVYVFIDKYGPIYIGSSSDVRKRLNGYKIRSGYGSETITPWGQFTALTLKVKLSERLGDWAMWEIRLINRLQPRCNRRHVAPENRVEYGEWFVHIGPDDSLPPEEWKKDMPPREEVA